MKELSILGPVIKLAYEGEDDTNALTDALVILINSALQSGDLDSLIKLSAIVGVDIATEDFVTEGIDSVAKLNALVGDSMATENYVATAVAGLYDHKGGYNANTNTPDLDTAPSGIKVGDAYTVSVDGDFFAVEMEAGDVLIADQDDPTESGHWTIVNRNINSSAFATAAQGDTADAALPAADAGTAAAEDVEAFATGEQGDTADTVSRGYIGQNIRTGANYELVLSDAGQVIEMNHSTANALNIPANSAVAIPVNSRIDVFQYGAGETSITITDDTLLGSVNVPTRYGMVSLWKKSSTVWVVIGGAA